MKTLLRGALAATCATVFATGACVAGAPSAVAYDTQPPVLKTPVKARFIAGSRLAQYRSAQGHHAFYTVPMRFSWSATDNADAELNYDVWEYPQGGPPSVIGNFITETTFDVRGSDDTGSFGGGPLVIAHWGVQAYDNAGNSSTRSIFGAKLMVAQDDGSKTAGSALQPAADVRYAGAWAEAQCTCFADKTTHHTNAAGSAVVITVTVPPKGARRVALVMDQRPGNGRARVTVDGSASATIDTGASPAVHRRVVWAGTLKGGGDHTIRVINLATSGRARVDFDAVVVN
jgi:hypothetical protein